MKNQLARVKWGMIRSSSRGTSIGEKRTLNRSWKQTETNFKPWNRNLKSLT